MNPGKRLSWKKLAWLERTRLMHQGPESTVYALAKEFDMSMADAHVTVSRWMNWRNGKEFAGA